MKLLSAVLLLLSLTFSADFCIKGIQNPYPEPYASYTFRKILEKAVLETGNRINCKSDAKRLEPQIELLKETPIAFTPEQRVSAYNLEVKVSLNTDKAKKTFSTTVSYSQPSGSLGDLPRRRAIEDAFGVIYIDILEFIKQSREEK